MKAKGIDILLFMIYTYTVQQPDHDWYMQADKDTFVSIRKIYEKFDSNAWLLPWLYLTLTAVVFRRVYVIF